MPYETIHNRIKKGKKFEYHRDANSKPLPPDIVKTLRDNSLKYMRKRRTIYSDN